MFGDEVRKSVTVIAIVTMANIRNHKMTLTLEDGRHIAASFKADQEKFILEALMEHRHIRLEIVGDGVFLRRELESISCIHSIKTIQLIWKKVHRLNNLFGMHLNKF